MKFKDFFQIGFVILFILFVPVLLALYSKSEKAVLAMNTQVVSYSSPSYILGMNQSSGPAGISGVTDSSASYTAVSKNLLTASQDGAAPAAADNANAASQDGAATSNNVATGAANKEDSSSADAYLSYDDNSRIYSSGYVFRNVDASYFDDAVFVGNSRLQGFVLYSKLPDLKSYTYVGMTVSSYFTKSVFTVNGISMTASEALEATSFSKVYLKLGINEMGWTSTSQFIDAYSKIIEHIQKVNPDAIIFVQSVLPVSPEAIEKDTTLSSEKIIEYNEALMEMAEKYNTCYLDIYSVFVADDGYMPYEYSFDGVHLNVASVQRWLEYLLSHGV